MSDTLEDVLAKHRLRVGGLRGVTRCTCDWSTNDVQGSRRHAEHVAEQIREHWHVVEKVPAVSFEDGHSRNSRRNRSPARQSAPSR